MEKHTKVIGFADGEIDCKRAYIENTEIESACKKCGCVQKVPAHPYISYPSIGGDVWFGKECDKCGEEIEITAKIKKMEIVIEYDN